jgi:uncharacterized pyridoxal phosphate-containing UPF0001 family protein
MNNELTQRLSNVRGRIENACLRAGRPVDSVRLIAVTKNHPVETIQGLIDLGVRDIGENRVQEIEEKAPRLTGDFTLHMIGHLQTNKAQKVWPLAGWIQSIDREKLVQRLESLHYPQRHILAKLPSTSSGNGSDRVAELVEATTLETPPHSPPKPVLVEVNTTGEPSKYGCAPDDCQHLCGLVAQSSSLKLRGLMTIGPLGGDERAVRKAFALLRELSQKCCADITAPELSMGMSGDFEWAIEEGATMVRIGSVLVGDRG